MSAATESTDVAKATQDVKPIALWVVPVADLGGVARHVLDVFRTGMTKYRLVLFCPEGLLAERVRELGGAVITGGFGPDYGFAKSAMSLRGVIKSLKPAIVHSHLAYADFVAAAVLAADRTVKLVSTEHGIAGNDLVYHGSELKSRSRALMHSARLRRFDALIAVSEATRTAMQEKWRPSKPIQVIRNGVDPANVSFEDAIKLESRSAYRVLSLSRLAPEKGLNELVSAFEVLLQEHSEATLTIAGTGPLEEDLKREVAKRGLGQKVSFPGFVSAEKAILEHDVLVQLSVWENCSYTILDALAAQLGVVATPVGGNPEIVSSEYLAAASDSKKVAQLISKQLKDRSDRAQLPEEWPSVAEMKSELEKSYSDLYREVAV
ncbi:glycosyltransferase family 4 protein [Neomicrococcus lactis]